MATAKERYALIVGVTTMKEGDLLAMGTSGQKKHVSYPVLDIVKLVAAIVIVAGHTNMMLDLGVPWEIGHLVEASAQMFVPFFFVASAFLCFKGLDMDSFTNPDSRSSRRVRKTTVKLFKLYAIWTVVFIPITIIGSIVAGDSFILGVAKFVRGTLFAGENYYSWPLWYLLAGAIGFGLVYVLLCRGWRYHKVFIASIVFLVVGAILVALQAAPSLPSPLAIIVDAYFEVFVSARNGLFVGFFYIALGMVFAVHWDKVSRVPTPVLVVIFILSLFGISAVTLDAHYPFCIGAGASLFLLSVKRSGTQCREYPIARHFSTGIYLSHMFFAALFVYVICGGTNPIIESNGISCVAIFLFALGGATAASCIAEMLSKRWSVVGVVFGYK